MFRRPFLRTLATSALGLAFTAAAHAAPHAEPLTLEVYNPGGTSLFPVSSTIVAGKTEVLLIDAQFQRNDAEALVARIQATGKKLTTIYISHGDPDYYFGLDVIHRAFPEARIVATPQTVAHIRASKDGKLAYWGPILKDKAPQEVIVPAPLNGTHLTVDGQRLDITGPEPERRFVWVPSVRAVVGGIPVAANIHVWMADTQTPASRQQWQKTLKAITTLQPRTVVPGHYLPNPDGSAPTTLAAVSFTQAYLQTFEQAAARAGDSTQLIAAMKHHYPQLGESASLELGAKVVKGELKWPQ